MRPFDSLLIENETDCAASAQVAATVQAALLGLVHRTSLGERITRHGLLTRDAAYPLLAAMGWRHESHENLSATVQAAVQLELNRPAPAAPLPPAEAQLGQNLALVVSDLGLDPVDAELLLLVLALQVSSALSGFANSLGPFTLGSAAEVCAAAMGREPGAVARALGPKGPLVRMGLIHVSDLAHSLSDKLEINRRVWEFLQLGPLEPGALQAHLVPEAGPAELGLRDFAHLQPMVGTARHLLQAALDHRATGINVLLHGPTGTGKTELARVLAAAIGARLHLAGLGGEDGSDPSSRDRLMSLAVGDRLLGRSRALLLFDEAEDLGMPDTGYYGLVARSPRISKHHLNTLLEANEVPTIWTTNGLEFADPAFLRRFSFAIEFRPFGPAQRRVAWRRHLGAAFDEAVVSSLAERVEASPAEIAAAVRAGRLLASEETPSPRMLEIVAQSVSRLVRPGESAPPAQDLARYEPRFVNASTSLELLTEGLTRWNPGPDAGPSVCLYGPPGTGKSAYAHHLGRSTGRTVLVRPASQLLSMWVGGTERNIAEAFRDAERQDAILLLDECDSFLQDRRGANHSWELTQVNELLQQIERHPGITICTTNLFEALDQAALRRFTFKVEFRWLRAEQSLALLETRLARHLDLALGDSDRERVLGVLARLNRLAPGDFAAVDRRLTILGGRVPLEGVLSALEQEVAVKEGASRPVGF